MEMHREDLYGQKKDPGIMKSYDGLPEGWWVEKDYAANCWRLKAQDAVLAWGTLYPEKSIRFQTDDQGAIFRIKAALANNEKVEAENLERKRQEIYKEVEERERREKERKRREKEAATAIVNKTPSREFNFRAIARADRAEE